jgi:hypothetical protein
VGFKISTSATLIADEKSSIIKNENSPLLFAV